MFVCLTLDFFYLLEVKMPLREDPRKSAVCHSQSVTRETTDKALNISRNQVNTENRENRIIPNVESSAKTSLHNELKSSEKILTFVPMCADFYHEGHANLLKTASLYGNHIVVLLMTDEAMETYKRKPFFTYNQRKTVLESVKYISEIIPCYSLSHCLELTIKFKPQFFVHGSDWQKGTEQVSHRQNIIQEMKKYNGQVIEPEYTRGVSSTMIHEYHNDKKKK